jgi:ankyrin repeat protein
VFPDSSTNRSAVFSFLKSLAEFPFKKKLARSQSCLADAARIQEGAETSKYKLMTFSSNDHQLFDGMTPAHFACVEGHADCLTILLEHHADVTKEDDAGYRPVHTACYNGNYGCVEVLLKHGIDANIAESTKGMTPTYICCAIGHVKLLNLLIQHGGVDLDKSNSFDLSPVYVASSLGHIKILSLLIRHHADINKREKINGSTPLDIARLQCNSDVVGLLLENGAVDNPNHTIPYFASSTWKVKLTRMLRFYRVFID